MNPMGVSNSLIEALIEFFRRTFDRSVFEACERWLLAASGFTTAAAAVMGFLLGLFAAIKTDALSFLLAGAGWVVLVAILYFVGTRMLLACTKVLRNTPSDVSSKDYLDVLGLFCVVAVGAALLGGSFMAIKFSDMSMLGYAVGIAVASLFFASMYLNPSLINTKVSGYASAGQDAVSISVLTLKTFLRLAPVVFSLLALLGAAAMAKSMWGLMRSGDAGALYEGLMTGASFIVVIVGLLYPLIAYLAFTLSYLLLDIARSILSLPGLLEKAAGHGATELEAEPEEAAAQPMNPAASKAVLVVAAAIVAVMVIGALGIQGKKLYAEYQAKQEIARMEKERLDEEKRIEEQRLREEQERQAAEKERISKLASAALANKGRDAVDLLITPLVSQEIRAVLGEQQQAFERFFTSSSPVEVQDEFVIATGCAMEQCGSAEGITVVDTRAGRVHMAIYYQQRVRFLGNDNASNAPAPVRKWALKFQ